MTFILVLLCFCTLTRISCQKNIVLVQDIPNFPAYETNGEGPSSGSMKFLEVSKESKELDSERPDMPDLEPEALTQMQEKVTNFLTNSTMNMSNNDSFEDLLHVFPRFIQAESQKIETPAIPLQNTFEIAQFTEAWASSVYTYKVYAQQHSYPAINAVLGFSYWCSTGFHLKDQVVTWEGVFEYTRRLSHLWIRWAYAPGSYRILTTNDGVNWEENIPWQTGFKGVLWQWLAKIFWWWRWFYKSYAEYIPFPNPVWAKRVRIQMRESVFNFFGIYRVEAWMKAWTVMLKTAAEGDFDGCLITADGSGKDGRELQLMDCAEAIAAGDGRELWKIQSNFEITSYVGDKCIEVAEGDTSDGARVQINDCWISKSAGDGREKWVMDHLGLTRLYKDQSKCLTVLTNYELENLCLNKKSFASSTLNDGQHEASMAVDGYSDNYWVSNPGNNEATFTIMFEEPMTVKELQIKWKYPAEEFEVLGLTSHNIWEAVNFVKNNGKGLNLNIINVGSRNLMGLKLVMLKTQAQFNGQPVYGIWDIRCISGTKAVKLKDCRELEELKTNRFLLEDVGSIDLTIGPRLTMEKVSLNEKTNKLLNLVNSLVGFPKVVYKLLEKGVSISKLIIKLEEQMKSLDIKMTTYQAFLDNDNPNPLSSQGSSSLNPIRDCASVHKAFPHKTNGFYWIKPQCASSPMRVYCNFDYDIGKGYFFLADKTSNKEFHQLFIKNHLELQFRCASLGLLPLEITAPDEINTIVRFLNALDLNMIENQVIPLAYDWGCIRGACTGRYRSFNAESSLDITEELLKGLDHSNVLNMQFNLKGYVKDSIGFSSDLNSGYIFLKLDQFNIKGLICSHQSEEGNNEEFIKADCFTSPRGNPDFDSIQNTKMKIICPSGCKRFTQNKVWGKSVLKDDSSICRAAIHQGLISDEEGGKLELELSAGTNSYLGSFENGIQSDNYEMLWDRSFTLLKYFESCPIDKFHRKNKNSDISFLEEMVVTNLGNSLLINSIHKKENESNINGNPSDNSNTTSKSNLLNNVPESSSRLKSPDEEESSIVINAQVSSTDRALETIARIYGIQEESLKKNLKLAKDSELLVKQLQTLLEPLVNNNLNNDYLGNKLEVLENHYLGSIKLLDYLTDSTQIKLKWLENENLRLKIDKLKALKYESYHEEYSSSFADTYEVFDHPKALNSPSKWGFSKNNLLGHENAISQTSNINCLGTNGCTASLLVLRYKEYYDGILEVSMLMRDSDTTGIVFRYKDPFNYYVFEMKQQGRGWKRFRQVVKGVSTTIAYIEDGGYLQNIWYKIVLIFRSDEFILKMAQENLNLPIDSIPIVMKTESQELKRGNVGFMSNGEQGLYLDAFSVKPLDCIGEPDLPEIRYLPPECSRFKETYYGQMNLRWKVLNPDNFFDGPALWDFESGLLGKEKVIYQRTGVYSSSPEKHGTFAVLDFDKMCRSGVITVDFYAGNEGMIGLAFKYINNNNFYVVEVGGDEDKFIQIRKKLDGRYTTIAKNDSLGYQKKQWHKITIVMMEKIIKIYFSNVGEAPVQVFEAIENRDLSDGTIALTTFKTEAAFDNVKMSPMTDWNQGNNDLRENVQNGGMYEDEEFEENKKERIETDDYEKKIEWRTCVENRTPESRKKYCEIEFEKQDTEIFACYKSFCGKCCERNVDWIHPLHRFHCKQQCEESTEASLENASWKQCISIPRPKKSIYEYCENTFSDINQRNNCKLDSCNLCCVTSQQFDQIDVKDEIVGKCQSACMETFASPREIYITN